MGKIHTHYDNLMVARNAPAEVIRASYLTLSKKFHPDVNPSDDASRIMKIINNSYDVISDPEKRRVYDLQVRYIELKMRESKASPQGPLNETMRHEEKTPSFQKQGVVGLVFRLLKSLLFISLRNPKEAIAICFFAWIGFTMMTKNSSSSESSYRTAKKIEADKVREQREFKKSLDEVVAEERQKYVRPVTAPNGKLWPVASGYIDGYKRLNYKGKSTIQIENLENDNDFYVKLVDSSKKNPIAVRHALIKGGDEFTFQGVTKGKYQLMYFDIDSGSITKSQKFEVQEIVTRTHLRASRMKITLYKVMNGNFHSEGIGLDEFMSADAATGSKSGPVRFSNEDLMGVRI